jgi:hypothetical protein
MFMSAGLIDAALGHDRNGVEGIAKVLLMSVLAFGCRGRRSAVPPGVPIAQKLFLRAAAEMNNGGGVVINRGYFERSPVAGARPHAAPRGYGMGHGKITGRYTLREFSARVAPETYSPSRAGALVRSQPRLLNGVWSVSACLLAIHFAPIGSTPPGGFVAVLAPARRIALALAGGFERIDTTLRQWPAAGLSLLVVAILFGFAMLAGIRL